MDEESEYLHFSIMQTSPWGRKPWTLVHPPEIFCSSARWSWRVQIPDNYFNLWILLKGAVEFDLRGQVWPRSRPAFFLLPPGEPVFATSADGKEVINFTLHIERGGLAPFLRERSESFFGCEVHNPEELRSWCEAAVRFSARDGKARAELGLTLSKAIFLRCWGDATSPPPNSRVERLHSVAERMAADPGRDWSIEALARAQGLSAGRFTQIFRQLHGMPPKAWLTECRMERARRMLVESDASVQQIAEDLGYTDLFFFSRHFKNQVGLSPLAWRRSLKKLAS